MAKVFESPCPTVKVCVSITSGENHRTGKRQDAQEHDGKGQDI